MEQRKGHRGIHPTLVEIQNGQPLSAAVQPDFFRCCQRGLLLALRQQGELEEAALLQCLRALSSQRVGSQNGAQ